MAQIAGNLQRIKNGQRRYAITPRVPAGFIQPDQLQNTLMWRTNLAQFLN